ncbi:FAD/NAD-P-binding domain-containing protein [Mycena amicta]|nr:FAD/NAD-P-binding domain-containing protein [Mycena amicta]
MRACFLLLVSSFCFVAYAEQWAAHADDKHSHSDSPWTQFSHPIRRVAVIGAGPAGLQAAAALLEQTNITVRLFDRAPSPGGNWFYSDELPPREPYPDNDPSSGEGKLPTALPGTLFYEEGDGALSLDERWREHWHPRGVWHDLHTNSITAMTELPGLKYAPDQPWSASVHAVQRHVRAYASLHGLNANDEHENTSGDTITSYSTRVQRLWKSNSTTWTLTLHRMQRLPETSRLRVDVWDEFFDAVVVAVGRDTLQHVPDIPGLAGWSKAKNAEGKWSVYHSQAFRRAEDYKGKFVLIVGASVSGTEIARELSPYVDRLLISARINTTRTEYDLDSLMRFPSNVEVFPEIAEFAPLDHDKPGIKQGEIRFVNGTVVQGVDEIILATGYRPESFVPHLVDSQFSNLHWTGHYIHDPTLAYMHAIRPWTHGRYQAAGIARVWTGKARLPSRERMWGDYIDKKFAFGGIFDTLPQEALLRMYIGWLNAEAVEFGGTMVEPLSMEAREMFVHHNGLSSKNDFVTYEDYAAFDQLPQRTEGEIDLVGTVVDE